MTLQIYIQYKTLTYCFDEVDRYIKEYDKTKYLELFIPDEKDFDKIRYVLSRKGNI